MSFVFSRPLSLPLAPGELEPLNAYLSPMTPQEILQFAVQYTPCLFQTTAFGLTGLAAVDMLSKLPFQQPPLIFLDTLYHFPETLELVDDVKSRYHLPIHVYKPLVCETSGDFESMYGQELWEVDADSYDYLVKVEPARRAYQELSVQAVITGRRSSQGASRADLQPVEVDSTGLLKYNPFFSWTFAQVLSYINDNNVPRNKLLDQGYKSVGDWHSTSKSGEGDAGEREGRWKGKEKTECGLHADYFAMKLKAKKKVREDELRLRDEARSAESVAVAA